MRRLPRGLTIGAALAALLLAAPVGPAGAQNRPERAAADEAPLRKKAPDEVRGRGASISAMRSGRLSCGTVITQSTTLTADVGPCQGNGVIIGADNIMLNLNGYTISGTPGPGDGNAAGVRLPNRSGVLVTGQPGDSGRKGIITGFDAGVLVNGGSGNTVKNLTLRDNIGPATRAAFLGDGIAVMNSANNTIQGNTVDHNGIYDGIAVLGNASHENLIRGNTVTRSVAIAESPAGNGTGVGIVVDAFLDGPTGKLIRGNRVLNNTVRANDGSGISNVMTQDGLVAGNAVEDNGHVAIPGNGIGLQIGLFPETTETRMTIENNVIRRNGSNGIYSITDSNQVLGNTIEDNGWQPPLSWTPSAGLFMDVYQGGNLIERNTVRHNGPGDYGTGIWVTARSGVNGGVGGPSNNNRIQHNTVTDHPFIGIELTVTGGTNYVVSNYSVNNSLFDLADDGGAFGYYAGCGDNVWTDNTYETADPPCAGNGGTQVSVP
ncbi:MAG: right-handed parallel beta-helix repeat-containing protein [Actinobacteria bacterium]|nr:right-handed parallel beta-helix repeat-containing protein [Actinomycetota bacterium]